MSTKKNETKKKRKIDESDSKTEKKDSSSSSSSSSSSTEQKGEKKLKSDVEDMLAAFNLINDGFDNKEAFEKLDIEYLKTLQEQLKKSYTKVKFNVDTKIRSAKVCETFLEYMNLYIKDKKAALVLSQSDLLEERTTLWNSKRKENMSDDEKQELLSEIKIIQQRRKVCDESLQDFNSLNIGEAKCSYSTSLIPSVEDINEFHKKLTIQLSFGKFTLRYEILNKEVVFTIANENDKIECDELVGDGDDYFGEDGNFEQSLECVFETSTKEFSLGSELEYVTYINIESMGLIFDADGQGETYEPSITNRQFKETGLNRSASFNLIVRMFLNACAVSREINIHIEDYIRLKDCTATSFNEDAIKADRRKEGLAQDRKIKELQEEGVNIDDEGNEDEDDDDEPLDSLV